MPCFRDINQDQNKVIKQLFTLVYLEHSTSFLQNLHKIPPLQIGLKQTD